LRWRLRRRAARVRSAGDAPLELRRAFEELVVHERRNDVLYLFANCDCCGYDFHLQREFQLLISHGPEAAAESERTRPKSRFRQHPYTRHRAYRATDGDVDLPLVRILQNEAELVVIWMDVARYHLPQKRIRAHHIPSDLNVSRFTIIADVHDDRKTIHKADFRAVQHHACTARSAFLILVSTERQVQHLRRHGIKIDAPILATACREIVFRAGDRAVLLLIEVVQDQLRGHG
jgi:hypothetical protein